MKTYVIFVLILLAVNSNSLLADDNRASVYFMDRYGETSSSPVTLSHNNVKSPNDLWLADFSKTVGRKLASWHDGLAWMTAKAKRLVCQCFEQKIARQQPSLAQKETS